MNIVIPEFCYALNNMTINPVTRKGEVIKIVAFETGYYKTEVKNTQEAVNVLNKSIGVSRAKAEAMKDCSMFGWDRYKVMIENYEEIYPEKEAVNEKI